MIFGAETQAARPLSSEFFSACNALCRRFFDTGAKSSYALQSEEPAKQRNGDTLSLALGLKAHNEWPSSYPNERLATLRCVTLIHGVKRHGAILTQSVRTVRLAIPQGLG